MKKSGLMAALAAACAMAGSSTASAVTTTEVVGEAEVTRQAENTVPTDTWVLYTRVATPGTGTFVTGPGTPPIGEGGFRTETPAGTDKVFLFNYDHIGTPLSAIDTIIYSTYRTAGPGAVLPGLNIQIDENGGTLDPGDFATLVFEPIYNQVLQGNVLSGVWQTWNGTAAGTNWWSTQPIGGQPAGAAVANWRSWSFIQANNPNATIVGGFGINQGSGNAGVDATSDALTIGGGGNSTVYDFEPDTDGDGVTNGIDNCENVEPANKDECKKGGWMNFNDPVFKNQGDCVSWVNHNT
jgi:hypothetical protein